VLTDRHDRLEMMRLLLQPTFLFFGNRHDDPDDTAKGRRMADAAGPRRLVVGNSASGSRAALR
jgi:hypothetical protein